MEVGQIMSKKILTVVKKVCFGFLILYGFNFIVSSANIFIPINIITVGTIGILGFPGLFSLIAIFFFTK